MKAPDGGCVDGRVYTHSHTDIGRASRYEYTGQQPGIRIPAAITVALGGVIGFHALVVRPPDRQKEEGAGHERLFADDRI